MITYSIRQSPADFESDFKSRVVDFKKVGIVLTTKFCRGTSEELLEAYLACAMTEGSSCEAIFLRTMRFTGDLAVDFVFNRLFSLNSDRAQNVSDLQKWLALHGQGIEDEMLKFKDFPSKEELQSVLKKS